MPSQAVDQILAQAAQMGASDVHIAADTPVLFRINGELTPQTKQALTAAQAESCVKDILSDSQMERFAKDREIDTSYMLKDGVRFRVNCHFQRETMGMVARIIPVDIPSLEEVGLTELAELFRPIRQGLILFTGPTGSGKSTSLAALLHAISQERAVNAVTLEDPIEFLFPQGKGVFRQRQYGEDFLSFAEALKHVLRQDPDIVLVGEMRDPETIAAALTLAETGHLILATLHTPNTVQTVDRIIDVFPPHQQSQVRAQLSLSLKAIVAQKLLPKVGGGRIAAREVLISTPAVANIIRDNRAQELKSVLQTAESQGMLAFEKAFKKLYKDGAISKETFDFAMVTA